MDSASLQGAAPAATDEPGASPAAGTSGPTRNQLLVWTTTPWTLPGNVAVAVAPDVAYVKAAVEGETLILAEALVERVLGEGVEIVERLPGIGAGRPSLRGPGLRPRRP